jgi:hypothetical protein
MADDLSKLSPSAIDWLKDTCRSFFNPRCPSCEHLCSQHKDTGDVQTCCEFIDMMPMQEGYAWKLRSQQCCCKLNKQDIRYSLKRRAEEHIAHEDRAREQAQERKSLPNPDAPRIGPVGFKIGSVRPVEHIPSWDCCDIHNQEYGGPWRADGAI